MRKSIIILTLVFVFGAAIAQRNNEPKIPMIGDPAPAFTAETTKGILNFPADYGRNWKIILSHPRDFTPVCTSEILELGYMQKDFDDLGTKLVIVSTDTKERHHMWVKAMEEVPYRNNSKVTLKFPFVDDSKMSISHSYGMLHNRTNSTENVRGVYFIGPDNTIKATLFYPMAVGRNMDEIKRTLIALQTADKNKLLAPANWNPGDDMLVPHYPYTDKELEKDPSLKDQFYLTGNLMWFKKM
jgi:peroxiredoxin (alkyl hydroperoxide reductase subunit C)